MVWNAHTGKRVTSSLVHRDKVRAASFARSRPWVVTASDDFTAGLWDQNTGDPLSPPMTHRQRLIDAEFVEHDTAVVTTDYDGNRWKWPLRFENRRLPQLVDLLHQLGLLHRVEE